MSNKIANPFADPRLAPLADLLDSVLADPDLADWRRSGIASSIRKTGSWFGLDLHEIPANCSFLRRRFAALSPGAAGVSRKRLQNARSDLEFALSRYGLSGSGNYLAPLTGPWKALDAKLDGKYRKIPLSRFLRYLQFHGIAPNSVTDAHAQGFLEALEHESLCRNPRTAHQNTCRAWNRACDEIDGWPQVRLTAPVYRQRIGFPWSAFPQSFRVDVDEFFATQSGENFLCDGPPKPLAPRTIETQRDLIRCAASALVRAGMPIEDITDLSFLCQPENVRTLLEWEYERRGRKATKYLAQTAYVLRTVALYHADLPEQQRAEVVKLYRRVAARAEPAVDRDRTFLR